MSATPSLAGEPLEIEPATQLRFERLIADLTSRFVHVDPEAVDAQIEHCLRGIVETLDLDRSTLTQLANDGDFVVSHSWATPGLPAVADIDVREDFGWALERARRGEITAVARLDDLPDEARRDKQTLERLGNRSTIILPIQARGELLGAVAFGTVREERSWPSTLLPRLRLIADVFANAIVRKRADLELRRALDENKQLRERLNRENAYLREEARRGATGSRIIGQSGAIQSVLELVEQVAPTQAPVLVLGETGVGKGLVAEAIHAQSTRRERLLVRVNCAALPASLVESELFGRERGAYTGALTKQIGRFELAHQSSLFLDEIAELPLELQAKLLRVLEQGEFERLGSPRTVRVDVRIIAATNRNLEKAVAEGRFRDDLYYRLAVFPIVVPPLRERTDDVPLLVRSMVDEGARQLGKAIDGVSEESLEELRRYAWPGNVRELRNIVERALILSRGGVLTIAPPDRRGLRDAASLVLRDVERRHIVDVLERTSWRVRGADGAASVLGLPPTTLEARMAKLGIERPTRGHGRA